MIQTIFVKDENSCRHGGDLDRAIKTYGGKTEDWLDLSTGISPWSYPADEPTQATWRNLPPKTSDLISAASEYYQFPNENIVATPGSQIAIRLIPQLLSEPQRVAVPSIGYQEHTSSWRAAGHTIVEYTNAQDLEHLIDTQSVESCVLINPNNPTGEYFEHDFICHLEQKLSGILLLDEAFADCAFDKQIHQTNMGHFSSSEKVIMLKSIGKFFGLAGARVGFVIGTAPLIETLRFLLEPWSISAPSMTIASQALRDFDWQAHQRMRISMHATEQRNLLSRFAETLDHANIIDQKLFFTLFAEETCLIELHEHLAKQQIWSRLGDSYKDKPQKSNQIIVKNWLRLSLAGEQLPRLTGALKMHQI